MLLAQIELTQGSGRRDWWHTVLLLCNDARFRFQLTCAVESVAVLSFHAPPNQVIGIFRTTFSGELPLDGQRVSRSGRWWRGG